MWPMMHKNHIRAAVVCYLTLVVIALMLAIGCSSSTTTADMSSADGSQVGDQLRDTSAESGADQTDAKDGLLPQPDSVLDGSDVADPPIPLSPVHVLWEFPGVANFAAETFFNYPWPESERHDPDGTIAMVGFPNPDDAGSTECKLETTDPIALLLLGIVKRNEYRQYTLDVVDKNAKGFGTNSPIFLRFSGPVAEASLPTPETSTAPTSTVWLINVDANSPDRGKRVPVSLRLFDKTPYLQPNTLAVTPYPGFPLRGATQYALVIRRGVLDLEGKPLDDSAEFEKLKSPVNSTAQAKRYQDVFTYLATQGLAMSDIAAMTVFTTLDPLAEMKALVGKIKDYPASKAGIQDLSAKLGQDLVTISGTYNTITFQRGDPPYLPELDLKKLQVLWNPEYRQGEIITSGEIDESVTPDPNKARLTRIGFTLTLPRALYDNASGTTLANLPLVIYGHGTGGDKNTFVKNGVATLLAAKGLAVLSIDAVAHFERSGVENIDQELLDFVAGFGADAVTQLKTVVKEGGLFYNFANAYAATGNVIQSGFDYIWLAKVASASTLQVPIDGKTYSVSFDPKKIFYYGHSQGATTGPLAVLTTQFAAFFLSATGGHLTQTALNKGDDADAVPIKMVVSYGVCDKTLDLHHPMLAVLQISGEASDPINYAPLFTHWQSEWGFKQLFATQGINDHYVPPPASEALTTAARLMQVGPALKDVFGQTLLGQTPTTSDLSGNFGAFTGGFKQYTCKDVCGEEDHWVNLDVKQAVADWQLYFSTLLSDPVPTIPYGP